MLIKDSSVPVLVFKSYHHGSLGVARSLGRLGVSVYGIDSNRRALGLHSGYFQDRFIWNVDDTPIEKTVQFLMEVNKRVGKRCILMPTYNEGAVTISDYADILGNGYIFPTLQPQLARKLTNKREMYFLTKKLGIPTALSYFPQSISDLEKYLEFAVFPIILKGICGKATEMRCGTKMFIANTKKELVDLYNRYEDPSNPIFMVQEYIPGGEDSVWMFNGYFNSRSECLFEATGRKIRQTPPYTGMTSLGICLRNNIVAETTKRFMSAIGYKGILDIGYRFDKRDGKYKVLDVNPRIGCTFRLFVDDNGMDVARAQYLDLTGQNVPTSHIIEGRKWLVEDADFFSSMQYHRDKNLTIRQWAKSFQGVKETAWFSSDDLFPFLAMCGGSLSNIVHKTRKIMSSGSSLFSSKQF